MNTLRVYAAPRNQSIRVYVVNHVNEPTPIAIDIELDPSVRENMISAELLALRYALSVLLLGGNERVHGKGLSLTVSYGAIRKLYRQDSALAQLSYLCQFLRTRYLGAEIHVENRRPDWANDALVSAAYSISAEPQKEVIESRFGQLAPTAHAIERMVEREICSSIENGFQVMINLLTSSGTRQLSTTSKSSRHCHKKYGKNIALFYHDTSRTMFVTSRHNANATPVILTAYKVRPEEIKRDGLERIAA